MHLDGGALEHRRVLVITLIAWLPLLVLTVLERRAWSGVQIPYLFDAGVHARLLVALPLLIVAERRVHEWLRGIPRQLLERQIVASAARPQLDAAVRSVERLRDSMFPEALLLVFVYTVGVAATCRGLGTLDMTAWFSSATPESKDITLAGWWYVFVSLPIFQFLLYRWYWRLIIWARFLWQVSHIDLELIAIHPDGAGGLDFLGRLGYAFSPLLLAHGVLVSGVLADSILFRGMTLPQYATEIAALVILGLSLVIVPLLPFVPRMVLARHVGLHAYGYFAQCYVRQFDEKWLSGTRPSGERLIGSSDIQSLADLGNAYQFVKTMRLIPISMRVIAQLALVTVAPVAPLTLTMVPLGELVENLLKAVV